MKKAVKKAITPGSTERKGVAIAAGFAPVVSELNDIGVAITGYDAISGEDTPRWMGVAGLLLVGGGAAAIKMGTKATSVVKACKCFTAGTIVKTDKGDKPIEEIKVGDRVLAKDDKTGKQAYKEVEWLFKKTVHKVYDVHIGKTIIHTTEEHPFWVKGFGWVAVEDLKPGMLLEDDDGKLVKVDQVIVKKQQTFVYNFKVRDYHSYYVSNLHIWTHNSCIPWSSNQVKSAASKLNKGEKEVTVKNRSQAEELFLRVYQGKGYKNSTGMGSTEAKSFFKGENMYHWDDKFGKDGYLLNHDKNNPHAKIPHLQIHPDGEKIIRIFWER
ncbi:polymorphic toxin-type HINT domain-containing protein [Seinonella peptonophila]|uniref:polymorphic toxin-type HINT domain-containing protein n=1 Tax=Seinonella peptonophila TaxID=112248 RepID=UPI001114CA2E|nr:polymorphic toxin-type HINT domain-containing protein [Seinonella peptonophila]